MGSCTLLSSSVVLLCLLLPGTLLHAQVIDSLEVEEETSSESGSSSFELTGRSYLEGQYATQQGIGQFVPSNYARWYFTPTFILFDIPFTGSLLLSTEQSRGRQSINSVNLSFSLDQEQLQSRLRDRLLAEITSLPFAGTIDDVESLGDIEGALDDPSRLADMARLEERVSDGTASVEERAELEEMREEGERLREQYEKLKGIREKVGEADELRRVAETGYASDEMYDPDHLHGALDQLGMLSGAEKFLYNFPRFGIGVNYPTYSDFTMNGVAVNGLDVVFNPGNFYLATTIGTATRDVPEALANDTTYIAFDRTLYAGRIGYGKEGETRFLLTGIYAGDEETSVIVDTASGFYLAPQENWVLGVDFEVPIVPEYFSIEGEAAGSVLTGELGAPELDVGEDLAAPEWLTDLIGFRTSSFLDYAFRVTPTLTIPSTNTEISGGVEYIGPGYVSLGIPYLRNDLFRYETRLRQKLFRRQVSLDLRYRHDRDNLIDSKRSTTETDMLGLGLAITPRKLPFLRVNVTPYWQKNNAVGEFQLDNTIMVVAATLGHRYRFGSSFGGMTSLTYLLNDLQTLNGSYDSRTTTWIATQMVNIGTSLTITGTGSMSDPTSVLDTLNRVTTIDIGANVTFLEDWNASLGGVLVTEENIDSRTGFYAGLMVPIDEVGSLLELRAERNLYDAAAVTLTGDRETEEMVFRGSVTTTW